MALWTSLGVAGPMPTTVTAATGLPFSDLQGLDSAHLWGISTAWQMGFINGFPNGTFQPSGVVTRAQSAAIIYRVIQRQRQASLDQGSGVAIITPFSGLNTQPSNIVESLDGNLWFAQAFATQPTTTTLTKFGMIGMVTPSGKITEFSTGLNPASSPEGIVVGPGGNLWFTDFSTNPVGGTTTPAIGMVTPSGQITEFSTGLNPGSTPFDLTAGPGGNLWFTDPGFTSFGGTTTPAIGMVTPSGVITEFSTGLNPGSFPSDLVMAPDGNLWFTDSGTTPAIGMVTPSGQITEFSTGLNPGSAPFDLTAGPGGNLWFTDPGSTSSGSPVTPAIGMVTPSGVITEFSTGLNPGSSPADIIPGPGGNLWFTDTGTTPAIGMITPSGQITEFSAGLAQGSAPSGLMPGPDGNLWFTDTGTTSAIGMITPSGQITEFSAGLAQGSAPSGLMPGSDGNLWFSDQGTTPAIGMITPSGQITEFNINVPGPNLIPKFLILPGVTAASSVPSWASQGALMAGSYDLGWSMCIVATKQDARSVFR